MEQAKIFKDKGTEFFRQNKFELAANKYRKIVDFLEHELSLKGDIEEERKNLLLAGRLNLAMCLLKVNFNTSSSMAKNALPWAWFITVAVE